jgi:hypothetical protein
MHEARNTTSSDTGATIILRAVISDMGHLRAYTHCITYVHPHAPQVPQTPHTLHIAMHARC